MVRLGIHSSTSKVTEETVKYPEQNQKNHQETSLQIFLGIPCSQCLQAMATDGIYGNKSTLRTTSDIYNIDITLVSSLTRKVQLEINSTEFQCFGRIVLGYFAEGNGQH